MTTTLKRLSASAALLAALLASGLALQPGGDSSAQDFHFRGGSTLQDFHRGGAADLQWGVRA
jgi:hypothetical protein